MADTDKSVTFAVNDEVKALIESGDILVSEATVDVNGTEVKYNKMLARSLKGATALIGGDVDLNTEEKDGEEKAARGKPSVCSAFNYGFDLTRKREVRQEYLKRLEGPEKGIKSGVKALMALGYTQAQAEAIAKNAPNVQAAE